MYNCLQLDGAGLVFTSATQEINCGLLQQYLLRLMYPHLLKRHLPKPEVGLRYTGKKNGNFLAYDLIALLGRGYPQVYCSHRSNFYMLQLFKNEALFIPGGWDSDDHIYLLRSDKVRRT